MAIATIGMNQAKFFVANEPMGGAVSTLAASYATQPPWFPVYFKTLNYTSNSVEQDDTTSYDFDAQGTLWQSKIKTALGGSFSFESVRRTDDGGNVETLIATLHGDNDVAHTAADADYPQITAPSYVRVSLSAGTVDGATLTVVGTPSVQTEDEYNVNVLDGVTTVTEVMTPVAGSQVLGSVLFGSITSITLASGGLTNTDIIKIDAIKAPQRDRAQQMMENRDRDMGGFSKGRFLMMLTDSIIAWDFDAIVKATPFGGGLTDIMAFKADITIAGKPTIYAVQPYATAKNPTSPYFYFQEVTAGNTAVYAAAQRGKLVFQTINGTRYLCAYTGASGATGYTDSNDSLAADLAAAQADTKNAIGGPWQFMDFKIT
jgi:hypothetical protein